MKECGERSEVYNRFQKVYIEGIRLLTGAGPPLSVCAWSARGGTDVGSDREVAAGA
jgi:hypothetical protein